MCGGIVRIVLAVAITSAPFACGPTPREWSSVESPFSNRPDRTGRSDSSPCHEGCGHECVCRGMVEAFARNCSPHRGAGRPVEVKYAAAFRAIPSCRFRDDRILLNKTHPSSLSGADIRQAHCSFLI